MSGEKIALHTSDGKQISAYVARPAAAATAGVVVVQEIFGVNSHIRSVTDRLASAGYLSIAPAFFDRLQPGVERGYEAEDIAAGRELAMALKPADILADLNAGIAWLRAAGCQKVAVVGFCFGGTVAWRAASASHIDAAVGYYGGGIHAMRDLAPRVPTMLHFGEHDHYIPIAQVQDLIKQYPDMPIHIYDADHGFHCDQRSSYDDKAAKLAYARTLEFLAQHLS
ncbi:MAG: dienelactone hydrolase family protein [Pseudoxanthomonas sp.]